MDAAGITAEARHRIFVDNPARAFAFAMGSEVGASSPAAPPPTSEA